MDSRVELETALALALADLPRVRPVLAKITDKWAVMILTVLCPKPARFNEIKRRLEGITHKALADALKRLERNVASIGASAWHPGRQAAGAILEQPRSRTIRPLSSMP